MKKIFLAFIIMAVLLLAACRGGRADHVTVPAWQPSEIYTDEDIEAAMQTVKDYFAREFDGCTLTMLSYPGDDFSAAFQEWAAHHGAQQAIILLSSFEVGPFGGDGSLNPNSTYENWQWILIRNDGGNWEHADHGY